MQALQETTDWGKDNIPNHIYFYEDMRLHAYIKQGTSEIIRFKKPLPFSKARRKFKKLKLENYDL
tara:strand:+ start:4439 stop:4633 length:195 start_codon:yes stop_codon:yes gene_type:complete